MELVNHTKAGDLSGASIGSLAFPAVNSQAGNLIVVGVRYYQGTATNTVTDTAGNTYTRCGQVDDSTGSICELWYAKNITGNASNVVTVNFGVNKQYVEQFLVEFSGMDTSAPLDAQATGTANAATVTSGTFSTAQADEVIVAVAHTSQDGTVTPDSGYTLIESYAQGGLEYKIVTSIQSNVTVSMSGANFYWGIAVASFKAAITAAGAALFRARTLAFFDDEEINRFEFWPAIQPGAQTFERSVSLDASAAISSIPQRELQRSVVATASASITVHSERELLRNAALNASATIETSGLSIKERSVAIDAAGSIATSPQRELLRSTAITGTADVSVSPQRELLRSAAVNASADISANPQRELFRSIIVDANAGIAAAGYGILERAVVLNGTASIAVAPQRELFRSASLDTTASIETDGNVQGVITRSAALSASSAITVSGQRDLLRSIALSGTASISVSGDREGVTSRSVALDAVGQISVSGFTIRERSVSLTATAGIQISGAVSTIVSGAASLNANATISVSGISFSIIEGSASLSAQAAISVNGIVGFVEYERSISLDAEAVVYSSGRRVRHIIARRLAHVENQSRTVNVSDSFSLDGIQTPAYVENQSHTFNVSADLIRQASVERRSERIADA